MGKCNFPNRYIGTLETGISSTVVDGRIGAGISSYVGNPALRVALNGKFLQMFGPDTMLVGRIGCFTVRFRR